MVANPAGSPGIGRIANRARQIPCRLAAFLPGGAGTGWKETMMLIRIGVHGLMLMLADLAGILVGFFAYKFFDFEQLTIQLPVAMLVSILLFLLWSLLLPVLGGRRLRLPDVKEMLLVFACSLLWAPVVFIPLHFFTQGYFTATENLVMLALYQMPINLIALSIAWIIQS
jgi:hypothetical protein